MELSDIDLNQLVLLQQLMLDRSVSRTAESLGLSQPAVSNTLAKLRRLFGEDKIAGGKTVVIASYADQFSA